MLPVDIAADRRPMPGRLLLVWLVRWILCLYGRGGIWRSWES